MSEAIDAGYSDRTHDSTTTDVVARVVLDAMPQNDIDKWWGVYDKSFQLINRKSPCRQSMYEDEFEMAMNSDKVYKVIEYMGNVATAMVVFGPMRANKELFSWISQEYYEDRYPRQYANDSVLYFVGICSDPGARNQGSMSQLLPVAGKLLEEKHPDAAIIFDCCDSNSAWLPDTIHGLSASLPGITAGPIVEQGTQRYYGFEISYPSINE